MIKKLIVQIGLLFTVIILITSCSLIGVNTKREAPKKDFKYPKFTERDSLKGYLKENRTCFDVTYYNLDIEFDVPNKSISGSVDIHFKALSDFTMIQLDLYENFNITGIKFEDKAMTFTRKYDAFFVNFNIEILANEQTYVTVYYNGSPQKARKAPWDGGFVWDKDKAGNPYLGVACELDGASLWWPLKDHLSDEPDSAKMNFTVPI